jgi:secreted PhoX family phosphatase
MKQTRKEFLEFLGKSAVVTAVSGTTFASFIESCATTQKVNKPNVPSVLFEGIALQATDSVVLAKGFEQQLLIKCGDAISLKDTFGAHNDYLAFIPLNKSGSEGILWSNHEYLDPMLMGTSAINGKKTKENVDKERYVVGGSLVHIKKTTEKWEVVQNSPYNRRLTGLTEIPFHWDEPIMGSHKAIGTFGNCAGGITPWGTILTCEENTDMMYGENVYDLNTGLVKMRKPSEYLWEQHYNFPPEHYGWVVEVNPKTGEAKKLVALGNCAHECATVHQLPDGRVVVYMGDDGNDRCLYKFIASKPNDLKNGTLYVANVEKGEWISVDYNTQPLLKKHFKNQTEVLIRLREAAPLIGGSLLNRPEDIEIDPITGHVFISLTNNKPKGDYHGSILKLEEKDKAGTSFTSEVYKAGGPETGFSSPDNLAFDKNGNLWFTTDVSGSALGKEKYAFFPCNTLSVIPRSGARAGEIIRVACAPYNAEFTGPFFHPNGKTLFLSIQHPGEDSPSLDKLISHWPEGGKSLPKSSVICVSGPSLEGLVL